MHVFLSSPVNFLEYRPLPCVCFFYLKLLFYERNKADPLIEERGIKKHTSKAPKMFPTDALALHIPNTIPRLQKIKSKGYSFQNI